VPYFRALYHLDGVVAQSVGCVYGELWRQAVYAGLVIAGALVGSRHGLPGAAAGVSVAILYTFVAMGQLALRVTGIPWYLYLRVTTAVTCGVAFSARLVLEACHAPSAMIALAVVGRAAVPWSIGMLWTMGEPDFEPLRARLPGAGVRLVEALRGRRSF